MAVKLKYGVIPRPVGRVGYNKCENVRDKTSVKGDVDEESVTEPKKTTKKKKKTTTRKKKDAVIEEPVTITVRRTVKTKASYEATETDASSDQENPGQPKDEDAEIDLDIIEVRRFLVEPARVNFHYSLKRSVYYQGVDVGCSVSIPCYAEEVEDALLEAKRLVAARLKEENRKTGPVLEHLIQQRVKMDQELNRQGVS